MSETLPKRIQLRRTKGWRMAPGCVKVDRSTRYGNPFKVGERSPQNFGVFMDEEHALQLFQGMLEGKEELGILEAFLEPLRGKDLGCWCKLCDRHRDGKPLGAECSECAPCHGDILLVLSNGQEEAI